MGGSWQLGLSWELGNRKSIVNGDRGARRKNHAGAWGMSIYGITLYGRTALQATSI